MASELAYEASDEASENELLDKSLSVWKGWNPASVLDNEDFSPVRIDIHTASSIGQYESVRSLINKGGIDIDKRNKGGWTPLMYASYIGHEAIGKLLIDADCDINMKNNKGQTPLMLAASCGNEAVGHLLVKHEAELEAMDKKGWTALFHATNSGHQNFVRFLLASGANMDAVVPSSGITPLMEAAAEGHEIIVQLFLQFGVNVNAKTYNGDMARSVALINGYMKIVSLIDNHLMPVNMRTEPDFSSSDEAVRRPRPQNLRGGKMKLKSGPSIRDGPDAIARLIDRSKTVNNQHLTDVCVPKGYVTFPQNSGDQERETQLSYRDVTSPINPEDYTLDSSGESYENEDDSNAFSKTGAITIKSSSSSSGGLAAALGLSRGNSLENDDFPSGQHHHPHHHDNNTPKTYTNHSHSYTSGTIKHDHISSRHHSNSAFSCVPITTLTPSSSCDEEIPTLDAGKVDEAIFNIPLTNKPKLQTLGQLDDVGAKTPASDNGACSGNSEVRGHCDLSAADTQLESSYRNLVCDLDSHLNSDNVWQPQLEPFDTQYSLGGRDSGISTNDAEEFSAGPSYFQPGIRVPVPGEVTHGTTVNKQSRVLSSAIAEKIENTTDAASHTKTKKEKRLSDPSPIPVLPMNLFPGQPIIPPSYPQDLASLLEKHGLSKYLSVFEEQDVDLAVFLSLTDNDLKEIGIKLFGPRKKMTNAIARWHSNAPFSTAGLEKSYADKLEGEMQEMAIQLNQAYNNLEKLKAEIDQEKQLRSVTEGCLLEQQEVWHNIHQVAMETRKRCDNMKDKVKKVKICLNDLKDGMVRNYGAEITDKGNNMVVKNSSHPQSNTDDKEKITPSCSLDFSFSKLDMYLKELLINIQFSSMSCDHISDKCVTSREHNHSFT